MPYALIVHAHPETNSFCTAQMREAASTLEAQGYTVEISDLYQMNWSPALGRDDFTHPLEGHFKPGPEQARAHQQSTFAPDVAAEIEKLL